MLKQNLIVIIKNTDLKKEKIINSTRRHVILLESRDIHVRYG